MSVGAVYTYFIQALLLTCTMEYLWERSAVFNEDGKTVTMHIPSDGDLMPRNNYLYLEIPPLTLRKKCKKRKFGSPKP